MINDKMSDLDITPSAIADRLCPDAAGPIVREMVEAIAERAIALTSPGRFPRMQIALIERNVVLAARVIIQRSNERLENLLLALRGTDSCGDDDDASADDDA